MSAQSSALVASATAIPSSASTANFLVAESDRANTFATTAGERLRNLELHVQATEGGRVVVVGEAAGWRGARQSGIAFTDAPSLGREGTREASATTVHSVLATYGLVDETLLWNALPLHPFQSDNPRSNRTPTWTELRLGGNALQLAAKGRLIVCVGKSSELAVSRLLGIAVDDPFAVGAHSRAVAVRHPSYGGAGIFRTQFEVLVERLGLD